MFNIFKKKPTTADLLIEQPIVLPTIPSAKELQLLLDKKEALELNETRIKVARYFNEINHPLVACDTYSGYGPYFGVAHILKLKNELELLGYELIESEEKVHDTMYSSYGLYGSPSFMKLDTFKMCKTITVRIKQ